MTRPKLSIKYRVPANGTSSSITKPSYLKQSQLRFETKGPSNPKLNQISVMKESGPAKGGENIEDFAAV